MARKFHGAVITPGMVAGTYTWCDAGMNTHKQPTIYMSGSTILCEDNTVGLDEIDFYIPVASFDGNAWFCTTICAYEVDDSDGCLSNDLRNAIKKDVDRLRKTIKKRG